MMTRLLRTNSLRWRQKILRPALLIVSSVLMPLTVAMADPYDTSGTILYVRPYSSGGTSYAIIQLSVGGSVCGTDTYVIMLTDPGGQAMLAAALEAFALNKTVTPEISNSTGCTGWGTHLQSLIVHQ